MRAGPGILCLSCALSASCTKNEVLNALLGAAVSTVLSAAFSAKTGGCFATCSYGTVCNSRTGLCERDRAMEAKAKARGYDEEVEWPPDEDCGGMCLEHEVCAFAQDELVCVPRDGE